MTRLLRGVAPSHSVATSEDQNNEVREEATGLYGPTATRTNDFEVNMLKAIAANICQMLPSAKLPD